MKSYIFFLVLILSTGFIQAQSTAGSDAKVEYRYLVDMPSAGVLAKSLVAVSTDVLPDGIIIGRLEVGVFEDISFGISYGGANIIGSGSPLWYKTPAVNIRFKAIKESTTIPQVTFGFDSQGKGRYFDSSARYAIKSPGLFASASKNFEFMGYLTTLACMNYSFEKNDGDNFMNIKLGLEKTVGPKLSLIAEYDGAFNDNAKKYGNGKGYMNFGLRWAAAEGLTLGLDLRDILSNKKWTPGAADRALKLEYIKSI